MSEFTHLDDQGRVRMVDVSAKETSLRAATAEAIVRMQPETFRRIQEGKVSKGNVFETARIAGILAAKRTADLIPMCHPLRLTHVQIDFLPDESSAAIGIRASAQALDRTGVEMEALTGAAVAALAIYDMCKAVDRDMEITALRLLAKSGGKSGEYRRRP
ncbi:MAG: cyclic pyranopterin monophosphate synthase MoaC [Desulfobacterales bacterium]